MTLCLQVIGKTGQLARALNRQASKSGHDITCHGRDQIDLTSPPAHIENFIEGLPDETDVVILAAAYTAVDKAETDRETAFAANATAPKIIAEACAKRGFALIHISTDYVFDGLLNGPYKPDHPTKPINVYGLSKRAGEIGILESQAKSVILRTSWVFDGTGRNFLTTMLRLGKMHDNLNIVGDQIGRPTYAGDLADAILITADSLVKEADPLAEGDRIFHVSNSGPEISWADFAAHIFKATNARRENQIAITAIATSQYPTPAKRPSRSVLDITAFEKRFSYTLPDWKSGLKAALDEADLD